MKRALTSKSGASISTGGGAPPGQAKRARPAPRGGDHSGGGGDDLDDGFGLAALRSGVGDSDFDASDGESREAARPPPVVAAAAPTTDDVPLVKKRGGRGRNVAGMSETSSSGRGSGAIAASEDASAERGSGLLTGHKRSREEMESRPSSAASAIGGSKGKAPGPAAGGAGRPAGKGGDAGAPSVASAGDDTAVPATYKRVATDLLSQKPAAAQAAGVWSAFSRSKTGAKLSDEEVATPLAEGHIAAGGAGAAAVTGTLLDMGDLPAVVRAVLPEWKRVFGWKQGAKKRAPGAPALVIVTYSAVRAAAMLKPLSVFSTRIAKLFGKHLSLEDQRAILRGPPITIAIGACR